MTNYERQMWELAHEKIQKMTDKLDLIEAQSKIFKDLEEYFFDERTGGYTEDN